MEAASTIARDMGIGPGDVVSGRYQVVRVIGHGGMGVVVEAVHEALGQRVAIKFLRPREGDNEEATTRFLAEARALAQLRSVHFPRVTDIALLPDATPYFVMEFLEGHDLGASLAVDGTLSVGTTVDYALQVCEALAEAYVVGIVHRDIKPGNLFLTKALDGSTLVKVLDFGISKYAPTTEVGMTATRALMGSPRYMAPEQMRSMRRVDHRADIWSLGVVMHEALTGQPPFVGETLPEVCAAIAADDPVRVRQLRRDVPIELQDIILRCLAKEPDQRYKDVGELASELAPFASEDAAPLARRVRRIVHGASQSIAPPRPLISVPVGPLPQLPGLLDAGSIPPPSERLGASVPPAPVEDTTARRQLRRWALAIVAAVALPAFIVGALQPSPPLGPAAATAPSAPGRERRPHAPPIAPPGRPAPPLPDLGAPPPSPTATPTGNASTD
jgi:serine/threonine-protein kinase